MNHTVDDAIKNANAHLNNVGLRCYVASKLGDEVEVPSELA